MAPRRLDMRAPQIETHAGISGVKSEQTHQKGRRARPEKAREQAEERRAACDDKNLRKKYSSQRSLRRPAWPKQPFPLGVPGFFRLFSGKVMPAYL
jgi:hypothetical protein